MNYYDNFEFLIEIVKLNNYSDRDLERKNLRSKNRVYFI